MGPSDEQLSEVDAIYHRTIDVYSQAYYSPDERRKQRDEGSILVVQDEKQRIYAAIIKPTVTRGDAIMKTVESGLHSFFCAYSKRL